MMQYLIECNDTSMCIIYKRSILVDDKSSNLSIGAIVKFLWPEDSAKCKEYVGKIVATDSEEEPLINLMNSILQEKKTKKTGKNKLKKKIVGLLQKEIMSEVNTKKDFEYQLQQTKSLHEQPDSSYKKLAVDKEVAVEFEWIIESIDTIQENTNNGITALEKIKNQLEFLKSSLLENNRESLENKEQEKAVNFISIIDKKRRSFGMDAEVNENLNEQKEVIAINSRKRSSGFLNESEEENDFNFVMSPQPSTSTAPFDKPWSSDEENRSKKRNYGLEKPKAWKKLYIPDSSDEDTCNQENFEAARNKETKKPIYSTNKEMFKNISNQENESPVKAARRIFAGNFSKQSCISINSSEEVEQFKYSALHGEKVKELTKGSGIFISRIELTNLLNLCKKPTELARGLFRSIFTEKMLSSCSLTGSKPKGFNKGDSVRPGLPETAVHTIISFALKYGKEKQWELQSAQQVKSSLRALLQEIKAADIHKNKN